MPTKRIEVERTEPELIELVMTREQAGALVAILSRVGGDAMLSARGHVDAVLEALEASGVKPVGKIQRNLYLMFENDEESR